MKFRFGIIFAFFMISLLVSLFAVSYYIQQVHSYEIAMALEETGQVVANEIEKSFAVPDNIIQLLKEKFDSIGSAAQIPSCFETVIEFLDSFERVYLLSPSGIVDVVWSGDDDFLGMDFSNQEFFSEALKTETVYWSQAFISPFTGNPTVTLSLKCDRGVIVVFYDLRAINRFVNIKLKSPDDFIAILDERGAVIGHTDETIAFKSQNLSSMRSVRDAKAGRFGLTIDTIGAMKVHSSTNRVEGGRFIVLVSKSHDRIFENFNKVNTVNVILLIAYSLLMASLSIVAFKMTFQPIERLTTVMRTVANGSYDIAILAEYIEHEDLIEDFTLMVKTIQERESEIKTSLREKEVLLRELYHRTKNNMQIIIAMMALKIPQLEDENAKRVFLDVQTKIHTMALVHQKLYQSKDLSSLSLLEFFQDIAPTILSSFDLTADRIVIEISGDAAKVMIEIAIPLGIVMNELITNSLKHAFPADRTGKIVIQLAESDDGMLTIHYRDDGVGTKLGFDFYKQATLGFRTIIGIIEDQLLGKITFDVGAGFGCQISFNTVPFKNRLLADLASPR